MRYETLTNLEKKKMKENTKDRSSSMRMCHGKLP